MGFKDKKKESAKKLAAEKVVEKTGASNKLENVVAGDISDSTGGGKAKKKKVEAPKEDKIKKDSEEYIKEHAIFKECKFCEKQCKYREKSEKVYDSDKLFGREFESLFKEGDLDKVAEFVVKKTIDIKNTKDIQKLSSIALCLYTVGTSKLDIPDVLRERLGKLAKAKISDSVKSKVKDIVKVTKESESKAESMPFPIAEPSTGPNPTKILETWITTDKQFLHYLDEIKQISKNSLQVKFDLETEGFLQDIKIDIIYNNLTDSGNRILKLRLSSFIDVSYKTNIIIGIGKKDILVSPVSGDLKDDSALFEVLHEMDTKASKIQEDRLTSMLNVNGPLKKMIGNNVVAKSPDIFKITNIKVPIKIKKREDEGCDLIVETFFNEKKRPYDLFINVMDKIAEVMDELLDLPDSERTAAVPMAETGWFDIKTKPQEGAFSSKFVAGGNMPDIKTCPSCNRPLPKASSTDYRRCPFCFEKL